VPSREAVTPPVLLLAVGLAQIAVTLDYSSISVADSQAETDAQLSLKVTQGGL